MQLESWWLQFPQTLPLKCECFCVWMRCLRQKYWCFYFWQEIFQTNANRRLLNGIHTPMPLDRKSLITPQKISIQKYMYMVTYWTVWLWKWSNMVHLLVLNTLNPNNQQTRYCIGNTTCATSGKSIFIKASGAKQLSKSGPGYWSWHQSTTFDNIHEWIQTKYWFLCTHSCWET